MNSLKGKTAIITGAGKGIGKAVAKLLASEGVNLGLIGRTEKDLVSLKQELSALSSEIKITYETADISLYSEVQASVKNLVKYLEKIDILINNAGVLKVGGLLDLPVEEWENVFKINVFGTYYMMHEILPELLKQGKGDVINIASTAGLKGAAKLSAYGGSKSAVINISESVMQEFRKSNIRVTTVNPSTIATDMTLTAGFTDGNKEKVLQPEDLAFLIVNNLKLPQRAFVKEIGLWSTNP